MFSLDGEYVDFTHSVLLEGPVEASCFSLFQFSQTKKGSIAPSSRDAALSLAKNRKRSTLVS